MNKYKYHAGQKLLVKFNGEEFCGEVVAVSLIKEAKDIYLKGRHMYTLFTEKEVLVNVFECCIVGPATLE